MPIVLQLQNAHKHFGEQVLLDEASVALSDEDRVGLVGRNGAGKTTLVQILLGEEELDAGEIVRHKSLRLGYLRQHDPFEPGETVHDFLIRDTGQPEWRCGEVAWQFRITDAMLGRPVEELSGGWRTRVKLAALLLQEPNLLLLDEPTNFLDLRTQLLLEDFLRSWRGGALIVSHDREFLKNTCTHTLELSRGRLTMFPGDVDAYFAHVAERQEHDRRVNVTLGAKKRQLETFIAKNRVKASTARQAQSKIKQLDRINAQFRDIESAEATVRLRLPQVEPRQGTAVRCEHLAIGYPGAKTEAGSFGYGGLTVATDVHLDIDHGQRIGIVGDNGQGKTTLLRTLSGSLEPLGGGVRWGYGCEIGVYAQHVYTTLPPRDTVREYLEYHAAPGTTHQYVLDVAGSFLFRGEAVEKPIRVLSGGERARLVLAGLLLSKHNVLLLDEPGNHLDVETHEALAEAMCRFEGTLIFTSHDRRFMHAVATGVIEVAGGRVAFFPGSYDDYLYRVEKEIAEGDRTNALAAAKAPSSRSRAGQASDASRSSSRDGRKVDAQAHRERQKRLTAIERKLARLDAERKSANGRLMEVTQTAEAAHLHRELASLSQQIEALEEEWLMLQEE
jgi:ATP-binding cassette subfamily F protein 3